MVAGSDGNFGTHDVDEDAYRTSSANMEQHRYLCRR